jgi:glycine oxidase
MPGVSDIVVAGAGAIGSAVAFVLARTGHRVTVVNPPPPDASASGVAAGMLAPAFEALFDPASANHFPLLAAARDAWPAFAAEIGLTLARDGALAIGSRGEARGWSETLAAMGAEARLLAPDAASNFAPALPPNAWAVFAEGDWRLDPIAALAALRAAAERHGARFVRGRVTGFAAGVARVDGGEAIAADNLVVATGAARGLAPELAVLTPIKGHILRAAGDFAPGPVVRASGVYLCRSAGELVLGATMEPGLADTTIDPAVVRRLLDAAAPLLAPLGPLDWRAATGVRASTADGLPLVGSAAAPGVILAVGARRNGWLLAPLIAGTVLDLVAGRSARGAGEGLDPARLAVTRG